MEEILSRPGMKVIYTLQVGESYKFWNGHIIVAYPDRPPKIVHADGTTEYMGNTVGCQCEACRIFAHASSCAVHNAPALPVGPCDCAEDKMVERVARAMATENTGADHWDVKSEDGDGFGYLGKNEYRAMARAAIYCGSLLRKGS